MSRRSLDSIPPELRESLSDEAKRELAALDVTHQRRRQSDRAGTSPIPDALVPVEAEAPGAARLYRVLPAGASVSDAIAAGAEIGMSEASVASALEALRRVELILDGPRGMTPVQPGGVPF